MYLRVVFAVHTPGQAHLWSNVIKTLISRGHDVFVLSRGGGITEEILSKYNIEFTTYGRGSQTVYGKLLNLLPQFASCFRLISSFHPDIIVGSGILEAHVSALLRKPCIIFEDTELTPSLERIQWQLTANTIISPSCFKRDLGKKHIRINSYKELAYLHPNHFRPDPSIFKELGIEQDEKYAIIRFNAFTAIHDMGVRGFSIEEKYAVVSELEKYVKVFISAEGALAKDLETYRLPISPYRIHHVLNYAQMIIGDSGTMTVESALLGTPGIVCESIGAYFGNLVEIGNKYGLLYVITEPKKAIIKAVELIQQPDLKERWAEKRQRLLDDKIDMTEFMVGFIENYPGSIAKYKNRPGCDNWS
jgi:predicted glycosyltransferase